MRGKDGEEFSTLQSSSGADGARDTQPTLLSDNDGTQSGEI